MRERRHDRGGRLEALLGEGRSANPHPVERTAIVEPRPAAVDLLRERRGTMVTLATTTEGS